MFVGHIEEIEGKILESSDLKGVVKKILISPKNGWETNVMRLFILEPGGYTPRHSHPWEHVNIVLKGSGKLFIDGKTYPLKEGSIAFVPENSLHQYIADKGEGIYLICIVPERGDRDYLTTD